MAKGASVSGALIERGVPQPAAQPVTSREDHSRLVWTILVIGVLLRMAQYLANRSLWTDECLLALNLIRRSFSQLLQPLSDNQAAPVGFLMLEKAVVQVFGSGEYALRALPLLAAIGSLFLFRRLAYQVLRPIAVPFAMALFAFSDILIYYASEVKQYSLDVAATLVVFLVAIPLLGRDHYTNRRLIAFAITGVVVPWFSHPSVFVLTSAAICVAITAIRLRRFRTLTHLLVIGLVWALNVGTLYLLSFRSATENQWLRAYWAFSFMPLPPRSWADLVWFPRTFLYVIKMPIGLSIRITHPAGLLVSILAIVIFVIGLAEMVARPRRTVLALLFAPLGLALFGSAIRVYPFYGRLLLFICPSILLVVGSGLGWIVDGPRFRAAWLRYACAALLLADPFLNAAHHLAKPREIEEVRPLVAALVRQMQSGDTVCLYYGGERTFEYYSPRYGLDSPRYVVLGHSGTTWSKDLEDIDRLRGNSRVWVVISHYMDVRLGDGREVLLRHLDQIGHRLDSLSTEGAGLYLYDLAK